MESGKRKRDSGKSENPRKRVAVDVPEGRDAVKVSVIRDDAGLGPVVGMPSYAAYNFCKISRADTYIQQPLLLVYRYPPIFRSHHTRKKAKSEVMSFYYNPPRTQSSIT